MKRSKAFMEELEENSDEHAEKESELEGYTHLRDLMKSSTADEVSALLDDIKKENSELFSSEPSAIGASVSPVEIRKSSITEKSNVFETIKDPFKIENGTSLMGKFSEIGLDAEGMFYPLSEIGHAMNFSSPESDIIVENGSPTLNSCLSMLGTAILLGHAESSLVKFRGYVTSTVRSPLPFDESEQRTIFGTNKNKNFWNEVISARISREVLLFTPTSSSTTAVSTMCRQVNAMIFYDTAFNSLDCSRLLHVKRTKRVLHPLTSKEPTLLPQIMSVKCSAIGNEGKQGVETCKYLNNSQTTYIDHPLNLLSILAENELRLSSSEDPHIFVTGIENILDAASNPLQVAIKTYKGFEVFSIPEGRLAEELIIDTNLEPTAAWDKLIIHGTGGFEESSSITVETQESFPTFNGNRFQVSEAIPRATSNRSTSGRGRGRGGRTQDLYVTNPGAQNYATNSVSGFVFGGIWGKVPLNQRSSYLKDLKYGIWLAKAVHGERIFANRDDIMVRKLPCTLIYDAIFHNPDKSGENTQITRRYDEYTPWSMRTRRIPMMKFEKLNIKINDLNPGYGY
jgi:hypothetical protein